MQHTRQGYYENLNSIFWNAWMDELFSCINWWASYQEFYWFCIWSWWKDIIEKICVFSLIELEIIWNKFLSESIFNYLSMIWMSYSSIRFLTFFYSSRWNYTSALDVSSKLIWDPSLNEDIDLLKEVITLTTLNWKEWNYDLLEAYWTLICNTFDYWTITDEENANNSSFYYHRLIILQLANSADIYEVIETSLLAIEAWNTDAYYYLIHCYLTMENYSEASKYYSEWHNDTWASYSFESVDEREIFYFEWFKSKNEASVELLVDFYREEFVTKWYNDAYFNNFINLLKDYGYKFTDDDTIFFDKFNDHINSIDNSNDVIKTISFLFAKYETLKFTLYLDKILLIVSKYLRWIYWENPKIKQLITFRLERFTLYDELNKDNNFEVDLFNSKIEAQYKLLDDPCFLEERFTFLLLTFSKHNLETSLWKNISNATNIWLTDDYISLPISLASIFNKYWLHEEEKLALSYDRFFKAKAPEVKKKPINKYIWLDS